MVVNTLHTELGGIAVVAVGAVAAGAATVSAFFWYKRRRSNKPPEKWVKMGEVSSLYLYPIKSCKGLKLDRLECTLLGGRLGELRDRTFIVINSEGKFVSGKDIPKLIQVEPLMQDGKLKLSAPDYPETVEINFHSLSGSLQKVRIWDAVAEGVDCGDDVARWLSRFILGQDAGLRILYYGDREVPKGLNTTVEKFTKLAKKEYKDTDASFFSDGAAYHLISEVSVKELNSRLEDNVSPLNFRPNIVIKGTGLMPFEEDNWNWIKIGDAVFQFLSPCGRCLFTTVDPASSKKSEKMEPLATLKKYRFMRDTAQREIVKAPAMGIYLGARSKGLISVGDDVMIPVS